MGSPYRPPCGGWPITPRPFWGGCFQNRVSSEASVQRIKNMTQVPDPWHPGMTRDPYTRVEYNLGGTCQSSCVADDGTRVTPCAPWRAHRNMYPDGFTGCTGGQSLVDDNCFAVSSDYLDFSVPHKFGFKNVQIRHPWHGRRPFTSIDPSGGIAVYQMYDSNCSSSSTFCDFPAEQQLPFGVKYLTIKRLGRLTSTGYNPDGTVSGTPVVYEMWYQMSVDRWTGQRTLDAYDSSGNFCLTESGAVPPDSPEFQAHELAATDYDGYRWSFRMTALDSGSDVWGSNIGIITALKLGQGLDTPWHCQQPPTPGLTTLRGLSAISSVDDTHLVWTVTEFIYDDVGTLVSTTEWHGEATLSNPYTSADLRADMNLLFSQWDMTDDKVYPWRTDAFCGCAPLISFDGLQTPVSPDGYQPPCFVRNYAATPTGSPPYSDGSYPVNQPWFDPDTVEFYWATGQDFTTAPAIGLRNKFLSAPVGSGLPAAIVGGPLWAGSDGHFDWMHLTTKCCNDGSEDRYYGWGMGAWSGGVAQQFKVGVTDMTSNGDMTSTVVLATPYADLAVGKTVTFGGMTLGQGNTLTVLSVINSTTFTVYGNPPGTGFPTSGAFAIFYVGHYSVDPTDEAVPPTATQWTENGVLGENPGGAWIKLSPAGLLTAQKWAEIYIPRPSVNWFRPCGPDRYALDESKVACAWPVDTTHIGCAATLTAGTLYYIAGVTGITGGDGIYTVVTSGPSQYAVTPVLTSVAGVGGAGVVRNVPAMNPGTGIIGPLRFPSAFAICGRAAIHSATNSAVDGFIDVILLTPGAPYLRTGDRVDVSGLPFEAGSGSTNLEVEVYDDTHFSIPGTLTDTFTGTDTSPTAFIKTTGAPDYPWNDTDSKGDFVIASWIFNLRDYAERQRIIDLVPYLVSDGCSGIPTPGDPIRAGQTAYDMPQGVYHMTADQSCVTFSACAPSVLCITPGAMLMGVPTPTVEHFANAHYVIFPDNQSGGNPYGFMADEYYGFQWQAAFIQHMVDPFWMPPHPTCIDCESDTPQYRFSSCTHLEAHTGGVICPGDDAGCPNNCGDDPTNPPGNYYYPQRPWVEARLGQPDPWNGDTAPTYQGPPLNIITDLDVLNAGGLVSNEIQESVDMEGSPEQTETTGNVLPPPPPPGLAGCSDVPIPNLYPTPWTIYLEEYQCVCANGQFAADYKKNGVSCIGC